MKRLDKIIGTPPQEGLRLVLRKAIYRKLLIGEFGVRAGDIKAPTINHDLVIEFLDRDEWDETLENNPYLSQRDLERFRNRETTCIVARDGDRIVASTWMLRGEAYVDELFRTIPLPEGRHFSCSSFVAPDYRGMGLMGHMVHQSRFQGKPACVPERKRRRHRRCRSTKVWPRVGLPVRSPSRQEEVG